MRAPRDAQDALDLIDACENLYKPAYAQFEEDEKFYDGDFEQLVSIPDEYPLTIPSTLRAIVDEAIDNIMPGNVAVVYHPRDNKKQAEDDADLIRQACKAAIQQWRSAGDVDQLREAARYLFMSGLAGMQLEPDFSLWPVLTDEEEEELKPDRLALRQRVADIKKTRDSHFPLSIRTIPPRCLMPDDSQGSRKTWVIERYQARASEIRSRFDDYEEDFADYDTYAKHRVHVVWGAFWIDRQGVPHAAKKWVFVDRNCVSPDEGEPVKSRDLTMKWRFSGYGRESYEGRPELRAQGFFTKQIKSLGMAEARRLSQLDAIVAAFAFPIAILPTDVQDDDIDMTPGTINFVPDKVLENADKLFIRTPIPDRSVMASLDALSAQIQRGTTQEPLRGSPIPGTDSAAQYGLYTQQAKLRLTSVQDALEVMISWACTNMLRFVEEEFKGEISIPVEDKDATSKLRIGPKNIKGNYDVKITFMPSDEQVKERKLALANDAIVKGGLSGYDALEFAGWDNPNQLIYRRYAWDVMQEPEVRRALGKKWLLEYGLDADEVKTQEAVEGMKIEMLLQQIAMAMQPQAPAGPADGSQQEPGAALAQQGLGPMNPGAGSPTANPGLGGAADVQQGRI